MERKPYLIGGVVLDENGQPVSQAAIVFLETPVDMLDTAALSNESGSFQLGVPQPGRYILGVCADGFTTDTVIVSVDSDTQDVSIEIVLIQVAD